MRECNIIIKSEFLFVWLKFTDLTYSRICIYDEHKNMFYCKFRIQIKHNDYKFQYVVCIFLFINCNYYFYYYEFYCYCYYYLYFFTAVHIHMFYANKTHNTRIHNLYIYTYIIYDYICIFILIYAQICKFYNKYIDYLN